MRLDKMPMLSTFEDEEALAFFSVSHPNPGIGESLINKLAGRVKIPLKLC